MKTTSRIAILFTACTLLTSGLQAQVVDQAAAAATFSKIADASKPGPKEIYVRITEAVKNGTVVSAADKSVLKMDRAHFEKGGKTDAVAAIDFVLTAARENNARPSVAKITATPAEITAAAATAFRQIDGDPDNGEVSGAREAKLRTAVEAGISAAREEAVANPADQAERLTLAARKADKDIASGKLSADDKEDAEDIAKAYRILASVLTATSTTAAAPATPSATPAAAPAVPATPAATPVATPAPATPSTTTTVTVTPTVPATPATPAATPVAPRVIPVSAPPAKPGTAGPVPVKTAP